MKKLVCIVIFLLLSFGNLLSAQDTIRFKQQLSLWMNYNPESDLYIHSGVRYIPQLNFSFGLKNNQLLDFEASANIFGSFNTNLSDSSQTDAKLKPYRAWMRFSGKQFELRTGLQKINFGSATMLRPLMWFDEVDPRDPLKLTDGVWGILGRYYFLNNANVWLWALYGNEKPRAYEFASRNTKYPEFGGRIQFPLTNSELGFSYHHQSIDTRPLSAPMQPLASVSENKMGIDLKVDWHIGFWFEGVLSARKADLGDFTHQEMLTIGADYTFGIGSGLYVIAEHLILSNDKKALAFNQVTNFTATSLSYPIGFFDNINAIFYYDWKNCLVYNFVNWQRQFNKFSLNLMAYWNPKQNYLPGQGNHNVFFGGKGIQLMFIYNH